MSKQVAWLGVFFSAALVEGAWNRLQHSVQWTASTAKGNGGYVDVNFGPPGTHDCGNELTVKFYGKGPETWDQSDAAKEVTSDLHPNIVIKDKHADGITKLRVKMVDTLSNVESNPARTIHQPKSYWEAEYAVAADGTVNDAIPESTKQHYIKVCPRLGMANTYEITVDGYSGDEKQWTDTASVHAGRESAGPKNKRMLQGAGMYGKRGRWGKHGKRGWQNPNMHGKGAHWRKLQKQQRDMKKKLLQQEI